MRRLLGAALAVLLSAAILTAPGPATASSPTPDPTPAPAAAPQQISGGEIAPIAVLLDTSGSMNEDDGAGVLKLRGAKNAVRDIVRQLGPTTTFGLRTYPGTGGCDGGKYVYPPAPLKDPDAVLKSVEGITADGNTPTGEALRALADDLTDRGYTAATIVLVSDGESTCGTPPCDVAKQLVDEGFDVTVPTIGFRTSAKGTEELACVAEATGSVYLDAGDSDELKEQLDSLVRAQLELTVRYDPAPMPDGSTKITAVIAHKGGEDAKDVRVALTLANADTPNTRRSAIPPVVRVGNVPAGRTVERSWVVGTGPAEPEVTTVFTVSAWGTNAVRVASTGEYTPKPFSRNAFGSIFDVVSKAHPIAIFGDSYSSGEGVGEGYHPGTDSISEKCHRSHKTYLGSAFPEDEVKILACSGAVMSALQETSDRAKKSQIAQLEDLGVAPSLGVMTIGGNDIGFADVVTMCLHPTIPLGCADQGFFDAKLSHATNIEIFLDETYRAVWSALNTPAMREARGGAYAPLVVLPYPQITWKESRGTCRLAHTSGVAPGAFTPAELIVAETIANRLNLSIKHAVESAREDGYEVYYANGVDQSLRPDHTLCEAGDKAFANGWIFAFNRELSEPESAHPKASGYQAMTAAIASWSKTIDPAGPGELTIGTVRPQTLTIGDPPPTTIDIRQTTPSSLTQGGSVRLQGGALLVGSAMTAEVHSKPVILGTVHADENGELDALLSIPMSVEPGQHTLVLSGFNTDGEFIEKRIPVSVVFPTPWWVWAALAVAGLLLLTAGVAFMRGLLGRRRARTAAL